MKIQIETNYANTPNYTIVHAEGACTTFGFHTLEEAFEFIKKLSKEGKKIED
jgi:hypothetical protein